MGRLSKINFFLSKAGLFLTRKPRSSIGEQAPVLGVAVRSAGANAGYSGVIQVGANDGVMEDPVREIILELGLPSLLVEPSVAMFAKLVENYKGVGDVQFLNAAVSDVPGQLDLWELPSGEGLPVWAQGLASFDKRVILEHRRALGMSRNRLESILARTSVPVISFADLLLRFPAFCSPVLVQVDTEGHDGKVIRGLLATKCRPALINYEHKHLGFDEEEELRGSLVSEGYQFIEGIQDTLAVYAGVLVAVK